MNIAFKAAYQYNPSNKKDLKAVNSIINTVGKDNSLKVLSENMPSDAVLFTEKHVDGFKKFLIDSGDVFGPQESTMSKAIGYSNKQGVSLDGIQYTKQYEKINFNMAKKALYAVGRALRQVFP